MKALRWLAALTPLGRTVLIGAIVAIIAVIWIIIQIADRRHQNALDVASDAGAAGAIIAGQAQTLDQLGDANHAAQDLRSAGERSALRYNSCLLDSRDRDACERYNPLPSK